jgi:hypothetical protein
MSTSTGTPTGSSRRSPIHPWPLSDDVSRHDSLATAASVPSAFTAFIAHASARLTFFSYPGNVVGLYSSGGANPVPVPWTTRNVLSVAIIAPSVKSHPIASYPSPPLSAGSRYQ